MKYNKLNQLIQVILQLYYQSKLYLRSAGGADDLWKSAEPSPAPYGFIVVYRRPSVPAWPVLHQTCTGSGTRTDGTLGCAGSLYPNALKAMVSPQWDLICKSCKTHIRTLHTRLSSCCVLSNHSWRTPPSLPSTPSEIALLSECVCGARSKSHPCLRTHPLLPGSLLFPGWAI